VRGGEAIRRRRLCDDSLGGCNRRFTTFERIERNLPVVIKRNGDRVPFEREKVRNGLLRATWKRRIKEEVIEGFLDDLERRLADWPNAVVATTEIAAEVRKFLRATDHVAFIRFESVYGDFKSIEEFQRLVSKLSGDSQ
jgi:transcriptional repressor NrdR